MKRVIAVLGVAFITACSAGADPLDPDPNPADDGSKLGVTESDLSSRCTKAYDDVRVAVSQIPADGFTKIPVMALARDAAGNPSLDGVILRVSRPSAGVLASTTLTLGPMGVTTFFTPCNGVANPSCLGPFQITMARASKPSTIVARTPVLNLVAPAGVGSPAACLTGGNVVFFDGDANDYIHPGMSTIDQGSWNGFASEHHVAIDLAPSDQELGGWWNFDFDTARIGQPIGIGIYEGAERYPFMSANKPGLSIYGDGRGCNTVKGRFQVHALAVEGTTLKSVTATFEQRCEGGAAALRGCVHFEQ